MGAEVKSLGMLGSFSLGVATTLILLIFYQSANFDGDYSVQKYLFGGHENINVTHQEEMFEDLAPILKKVASYDNTIIMTSVNWAWAKPDSLLDLFFKAFKTGEKIDHFLNHLLIVAFDPKAYEQCKSVHPYCYELKVSENFTGQQGFMSKGYIDLVWSKIRLQQYILEQGYNFLFTDVDILWFRNPFRHMTVYADMTTSCDYFGGNPDDINNGPNTGFFYVKSSNRTIEMMRYWHNARTRFPPDHEQNIFYKIRRELVDSVGVNIQFVDTKYFGCFCQFSNDMNKISTMHANCCVNGLGAKLADLSGLMENWKNYTALSIEEKNKGVGQWRKPGQCRLRKK
ncbi:hypothetical protein LUZ60_013797 [Juncus effusus]|nr:hypothetical protein LUZ60_013797 [Juncus effusus]